MSDATDPVLDVRGLSSAFRTPDGDVPVVRDVSLRVARGEKTAIVGESGSGKSALALSILGLIEPAGHVTAGEVLLGGRNLVGLGDRELSRVRGKQISLVYQDPLSALDPLRTIGDQVGDAILAHDPDLRRREVEARTVELLRDVEIPSAERRLDDRPHQYSGGMRQRVLIAIALANRPDVLIADEPTTALDVTTQAQILELLDRLVAERDTAVVMITHNLGIVAGFCDSVHVMYAGRLVERASVDALFAEPAHPYGRALLNAVPRRGRPVRSRLPAIPGAPPSPTALPPGCPFQPRCPRGRDEQRCLTVDPPLREVVVGGRPHLAACHFPGEDAARD